MEDSISMAVRCPCCDTFLFESDNTNTKQKCPTCKKDLMITISNGQLLLSVEGTSKEENYSGLVNRQINYYAKVSRFRGKKSSNN